MEISQKDLLKVPKGVITKEGIRENIKVGIQYVEAWLIGNGCVPLYNLMEDAATAEISRAQIWQWLHHKAVTVDGEEITMNYYRRILKEELQKINDKPAKTCPECNVDSLRKLVSAAAFKLKGTGWYETDFKTKKPKKDENNAIKNKNDPKKTTKKETSKSESSSKDSSNKNKEPIKTPTKKSNS